MTSVGHSLSRLWEWETCRIVFAIQCTRTWYASGMSRVTQDGQELDNALAKHIVDGSLSCGFGLYRLSLSRVRELLKLMFVDTGENIPTVSTISYGRANQLSMNAAMNSAVNIRRRITQSPPTGDMSNSCLHSPEMSCLTAKMGCFRRENRETANPEIPTLGTPPACRKIISSRRPIYRYRLSNQKHWNLFQLVYH